MELSRARLVEASAEYPEVGIAGGRRRHGFALASVLFTSLDIFWQSVS